MTCKLHESQPAQTNNNERTTAKRQAENNNQDSE